MEKIHLIYEHNKPYGIRNSGGFLFFFPKVTKFTGQEQRYRDELSEQILLAELLLEKLKEF